MALRFRKRIKIAPGISVNLSKNGFSSFSIGKAGAVFNTKNDGAVTFGIPGTGISYRKSLKSKKNKSTKEKANDKYDSDEDSDEVINITSKKRGRNKSKITKEFLDCKNKFNTGIQRNVIVERLGEGLINEFISSKGIAEQLRKVVEDKKLEMYDPNMSDIEHLFNSTYEELVSNNFIVKLKKKEKIFNNERFYSNESGILEIKLDAEKIHLANANKQGYRILYWLYSSVAFLCSGYAYFAAESIVLAVLFLVSSIGAAILSQNEGVSLLRHEVSDQIESILMDYKENQSEFLDDFHDEKEDHLRNEIINSVDGKLFCAKVDQIKVDMLKIDNTKIALQYFDKVLVTSLAEFISSIKHHCEISSDGTRISIEVMLPHFEDIVSEGKNKSRSNKEMNIEYLECIQNYSLLISLIAINTFDPITEIDFLGYVYQKEDKYKEQRTYMLAYQLNKDHVKGVDWSKKSAKVFIDNLEHHELKIDLRNMALKEIDLEDSIFSSIPKAS